MKKTMFFKSRVFPIFLMAFSLLVVSCQEYYTKPDLADTLLNQYYVMTALPTCAEKIDAITVFLDKNADRLPKERDRFFSSSQPASSSSVRDSSYTILAGARIETMLRTCVPEDTEERIPAIFERLHALTGLPFSVKNTTTSTESL